MKALPHSTSLLKPSTMENFMLLTLFLLFSLASFPAPSSAISYCNEACKTLNDCDGQLICINGKCDDDPDVGTHICDGSSSPPPPPAPGNGSSYCNGPCQTLNDCAGRLICINGKCDDDPDLGTHICKGSPPPGRGCEPSATMTCKGKSYPLYECSPPVLTSMTPALLTKNDFSEEGGGGGPSECDGNYHSNDELIVALSTGWYNGDSRCGETIQITAMSNGRSAKAKVVGECDSTNGCDSEHGGQPPCGNNVVAGSDAVWRALGLSEDLAAAVNITWSEVTNFFQIICFYE